MATRSRSDKKSNKPKLSSEAKEQLQTITSGVVPVSFTKQQRKEVQQAIERAWQRLELRQRLTAVSVTKKLSSCKNSCRMRSR